MTDTIDLLPLTVSVDADDWSYSQRRQRFLEAVVIQILRDRHALREWFSASELSVLNLPGMPRTKRGMTARATAQNWRRRTVVAQGGQRWEYHYSSLPPRAFDALVAIIVESEPPDSMDYDDADYLPVVDVPDQDEINLPVPINTAPPWVLPLVRLLRGSAKGDLAIAWRELPGHLPFGVDLPDRRTAAEVIHDLGLLNVAGEQ